MNQSVTQIGRDFSVVFLHPKVLSLFAVNAVMFHGIVRLLMTLYTQQKLLSVNIFSITRHPPVIIL